MGQLLANATKAWHGVRLGQPDWGDCSHTIAPTAGLQSDRLLVHVIFNAYDEALDFELPGPAGAADNPWRRWIDTSLSPPNDITAWQDATPSDGATYHAGPRSTVVLFREADKRSP